MTDKFPSFAQRMRMIAEGEKVMPSMRMRCCYYLQPWDVERFSPQTVEEWAGTMGVLLFGEEGKATDTAEAEAEEEAERLAGFLKRERARFKKEEQEEG